MYAGALPIGFWLAFWCALIRNANCTRAIFMFCFVLERCNTKQVRLECLWGVWFFRKCYWLRKVQQLIKSLTFRSVHFHPTLFTRPSFSIFRGSSSETKCYPRLWVQVSTVCIEEHNLLTSCLQETLNMLTGYTRAELTSWALDVFSTNTRLWGSE